MSTQNRLHTVCPVWQVDPHTPPTQTWLPEQTLPQPPQLFGSVVVLMQAPLQLVVPAGQLLTHPPLVQTVPAAQAAPHAPLTTDFSLERDATTLAMYG